MSELDIALSRKKLTYSAFVNIVSILAARVERIENILLELIPEYQAQNEFLITELLKDELHLAEYKKKIQPFNRVMSKRITEIDNSLKGFITYYHEDIEKKLAEQKPTLNNQPF